MTDTKQKAVRDKVSNMNTQIPVSVLTCFSTNNNLTVMNSVSAISAILSSL